MYVVKHQLLNQKLRSLLPPRSIQRLSQLMLLLQNIPLPSQLMLLLRNIPLLNPPMLLLPSIQRLSQLMLLLPNICLPSPPMLLLLNICPLNQVMLLPHRSIQLQSHHFHLLQQNLLHLYHLQLPPLNIPIINPINLRKPLLLCHHVQIMHVVILKLLLVL